MLMFMCINLIFDKSIGKHIQHSMIKVNTNDMIKMDMDVINGIIMASSFPVHDMNDHRCG